MEGAECGPLLLLMDEIRRSPVEVGSLSHYLQGFMHPRWCMIFFFFLRHVSLHNFGDVKQDGREIVWDFSVG